jgi:hypothetical protein
MVAHNDAGFLAARQLLSAMKVEDLGELVHIVAERGEHFYGSSSSGNVPSGTLCKNTNRPTLSD